MGLKFFGAALVRNISLHFNKGYSRRGHQISLFQLYWEPIGKLCRQNAVQCENDAYSPAEDLTSGRIVHCLTFA